jgi:hypothetical protein
LKLSEHKISKVLKEQDSKKTSNLVGEPSGHQKLTCYAVKALNDNDIVASYENICAAMWVMFPKVERFHLYGFDDIPDIDYMEKCVKLRGVQTYQVLAGGSNVDKSIREPFSLTQKGGLWANEAEAVLTGRIQSSAKEKEVVEGQIEYHEKDLQKIITSELYKLSKEEPDTSLQKPEIAYGLGFFYRDQKFDEDLKKKLKIIEGWLKQRKTDDKNNETDEKTRDFITWIMSKGSL